MFVYFTDCGLDFRTSGIGRGPLEWWNGQRWITLRINL